MYGFGGVFGGHGGESMGVVSTFEVVTCYIDPIGTLPARVPTPSFPQESHEQRQPARAA